jgi:uncharacterized glyoxalase superfamily protein PhnB
LNEAKQTSQPGFFSREDIVAAILDQLDLVSQNMEATIAFYRLLGAKIPKSAVWATESGAHNVTIPFKGGFSLAFDSPSLARVYNKGYRATKSKRVNLDEGQVVIGFSVKTRRSVDETYAKLTQAGHRGVSTPWDAFWGSRYAIVADPDGNHVGIMSPVNPKKRSRPPSI